VALGEERDERAARRAELEEEAANTEVRKLLKAAEGNYRSSKGKTGLRRRRRPTEADLFKIRVAKDWAGAKQSEKEDKIAAENSAHVAYMAAERAARLAGADLYRVAEKAAGIQEATEKRVERAVKWAEREAKAAEKHAERKAKVAAKESERMARQAEAAARQAARQAEREAEREAKAAAKVAKAAKMAAQIAQLKGLRYLTIGEFAKLATVPRLIAQEIVRNGYVRKLTTSMPRIDYEDAARFYKEFVSAGEIRSRWPLGDRIEMVLSLGKVPPAFPLEVVELPFYQRDFVTRIHAALTETDG
jgi:hypothetical protein